MSFLMSFALGAAKEYNLMGEEERAAQAEKKKAERAAEAEKAVFERDQTAKREEEQRAEEAKIREEERAQALKVQEDTQKLARGAENLTQYYEANPNQYHMLDLNTYEVKSFDMPAEFFTLDDATARSIFLNDKLEEFGTQYYPVPVEGQPDKFKMGFRDVKETSGLLFTDPVDAENKAGELNSLRGPDSKLISFAESTSDGKGYRVVTKQKTGVDQGTVYTTPDEIEAALPSLIKAANLTEDTADVAIQTVTGGFQVSIKEKAAEEVGPPTDTETDLPLTPYYYFARYLGADVAKDPNKFTAQVIDLTRYGDLPMYGEEMKNMKRGKDLVFGRQSTVSGTVRNATENLRIFLKDEFTPEVIDRAIEIYDTNPQALDYFVGALPGLVDTWNLATADQIEGSTRKLRPVLNYFPELAQYAEKHPKIREAFKKTGTSDKVIAIANARNGIAVNAPVEPLTNGEVELLDIPTVTDAFGVDTGQQDQNNNDVITLPDAFMQTTAKIGTDSGMGQPKVLKLLESSQDPNTRQSSPETAQKAFDAMNNSRTLLMNETFVEPTASGTELQFRFPSLLTQDRTKLVQNLNYYETHNDKILALRTAIPSTSVNTALSFTDIGGSKNSKARYEDITGNNNYDGFDARYRKAEQVRNTHERLVQLLTPEGRGGLGAPVGLPLDLTRLKAGAQYLLQTLGGIETASVSTEAGQIIESTVPGSAVVQRLSEELTAIQGSQESQAAALVNLNLKMQSYAYAAMMDPNGRLSDQDREQADQAIAASGYTANPASVLAVSESLAERAEFTMATIEGYTGGDTAQIIATHYYTRLAPGAKTNVRRFLGRSTSSVTTQAVVTQQAADDSAILNMYGGGDQETPATPVQTPAETRTAPVVEETQRPGNRL